MKNFCLTVAATALALAFTAPALAGVRCYSVFNIETGRVETVCTTGN